MLHHTKKVEINLGYACNAQCPFCYYYDSVITRSNENTLTTEEAKKQLRQARMLGIREIEFTGGEVTLRKDLPELIAYAKKELGFPIVCLITNGIKLAKRDYAVILADAGIDDILFSIHGHNAHIHDDLTKVPHSFDHIMAAIGHANELGLRVRTNTVVCKTNFMHLTEIMQLLIKKKIDNINFIMFNPRASGKKYRYCQKRVCQLRGCRQGNHSCNPIMRSRASPFQRKIHALLLPSGIREICDEHGSNDI